MKFCSKCGAQIDDAAVVCPNCGCSTQAAPRQKSTLGTVALVFMIISIVAMLLSAIITAVGIPALMEATGAGGSAEGQMLVITAIIQAVFSIIPLAWMIPMTVSLSRKLKNGVPVTTAFKVCTLIFVNLLSGILLLCMKDN